MSDPSVESATLTVGPQPQRPPEPAPGPDELLDPQAGLPASPAQESANRRTFDRTAQKIRKREQGHEYAERQLIARGARAPRAGEAPADWLARALVDVKARKVNHPGKHRYAWPIGVTRRNRASVLIAPRPQPYPKADLGQAELDLF